MQAEVAEGAGVVGVVVMQAMVQLPDHLDVGSRVNFLLEEGCPASLLSHLLAVNLVLLETLSIPCSCSFVFVVSLPCNIYNLSLGRLS